MRDDEAPEDPRVEAALDALAVHQLMRGRKPGGVREDAYAELEKDLQLAAKLEGTNWEDVRKKAYLAFQKEWASLMVDGSKN